MITFRTYRSGGIASTSDEVPLETIELADEAVRACPRSPKLWCVRGNLIELGPESSPHGLDEALRSYQRALEIDPHFSEGWEEIGHYYDAILGDQAGAQPYFRRAEKLREEHGG